MSPTCNPVTVKKMNKIPSKNQAIKTELQVRLTTGLTHDPKKHFV